MRVVITVNMYQTYEIDIDAETVEEAEQYVDNNYIGDIMHSAKSTSDIQVEGYEFDYNPLPIIVQESK